MPANTHVFTVTDTNGCTYTNSVIINEPSLLNPIISTTNLTSCFIANGSINLNVTGGAQPYTYLWNNNDTNANIYNLNAGTYFVTITDSNGCVAVDSATLNQPSNLSLAVIANSSYNGYNISCYNGNDGAIVTYPNGGTQPYSFIWNTLDTTQDLSNLNQGTYSLTITDGVGCSVTESVVLTEPDSLSSVFSVQNTSCFGLANGVAIVDFFGGATGSSLGDTNYILGWAGTPLPLYLPFPNTNFNTALLPAPYNSVPAGIYPYSVTDLNGCVIFDTITINQPDSLYSNLTLSNFNGNNISCNGFSDGIIDIQVNGGTGSYMYYFNGSLTTNTSISGLSAGIYTDSIIDINGCIFTEIITLTEPNILNNSLSTSNMSCNGICDGAIVTQINGGTAPYTYFWSNSLTTNDLDSLCEGNYTIDITDNNGCILTDSAIIIQPSEIIINLDSSTNISIYGGNDGELFTSIYGGSNNFLLNWSGPVGFNATTSNINNLITGTYFLTASDITSCSKTESFVVTQPSSLTANLDTVVNLVCNGICTGELKITANGGDSVYTYFWYGPNGYLSTNEDIDSLCAGTYKLELSDTTDTVTLYFEVIEPTPVTIISIADTAICYNGNAQANAYIYGGNYPYQTLWSNGSTNTTTILASGNHSISVSDSNGCITTKLITIHQQDSISISSTIDSISCYDVQDASVILDVTNGGTAPFQYSSDNGITFQNSNAFYNLGPGNNLYLVTDANGCSNYTSILLNTPSTLLSTISTNNATCFNLCDGTANITTSGGTSPYAYDWGIVNPNNLCAGLHNVTTIDENGCLTTNTIIINEPNPIIVNISQSGNIIEATSGFISYQWYDTNDNSINAATTDTFYPLSQGEYYVEVIDSNGCIGTSLKVFIVINLMNENKIELNIFPNPTTRYLNIETNKQLNSISIMNSTGNRIIFLDNNSAFEKETKIDLSSFAKGLYFIEIKINHQLINHKIILQ